MTLAPYYRDEATTIYHGRAEDVLPSIAGVDCAIVTDPPYGNDYNPTRSKFRRIEGDGVPFDPALILRMKLPTVMFGANHYASRLPDSPAWLVWDKRGATPSNLQADVELAWTNLGGPARLIRYYWNGGGSKAREAAGTREPSLHPNQKPEGVMRWAIALIRPALTIVDPYMGSGTTLVAAKSLNRTSIGIETDERYCEKAANRCRQEVLGLSA